MSRDFVMQVTRGFGAVMIWLSLLAMVLGFVATVTGTPGARDISEGAILLGANGLLIERWFR